MYSPRNAKNRVFAKGRLPSGTMNKTETAYAAYLTESTMAGEVVWWKFEAINLRLADRTFYAPDFLVMRPDGSLEVHEVKGAKAIFQDDAKVKIKVAAAMYPFLFVAVYPKPKKDGGGWLWECVGTE